MNGMGTEAKWLVGGAAGPALISSKMFLFFGALVLSFLQAMGKERQDFIKFVGALS